MTEAAIDVGNKGERIVADEKGWSYYAHLSIYHFALPYIARKRVLDAGCGTGYGADYFAGHGAASVTAVDASETAIGYCKQHFQRTGLSFAAMDLGAALPFEDGAFDTIFSSNVMEHIAAIDVFLAECARMLADGGTMVIAVPPVASIELLEANLRNIYHVTNLTPLGWHTKIGRFFAEVQPYHHGMTPPFDTHEALQGQFALGGAATIRPADFTFTPTDIATLNGNPYNITAIFVARQPRATALPPSLDEELPREWHAGTVYARILAAEMERQAPAPVTVYEPAPESAGLAARLAAAETQARQLEATVAALRQQAGETQALRTRITGMEASTSWRLTAPLRALGGMLRRGGAPR